MFSSDAPWRDHADVDVVERIENAARHARSVADVLADQADDRLVLFDRDFGELAQLARDVVDACACCRWSARR